MNNSSRCCYLTLSARHLLAPLLVLALTGCALGAKPPIVYSDKAHALSDTAVFSTVGVNQEALVQITSVDGKNTDCVMQGCPVWVRVLPGRHSFHLRIQQFRSLTLRYVGAEDVEVPEMKPKHVYVLDYIISADHKEMRGVVADRGEDSGYALPVNIGGIHKTTPPVAF